MQKSFRILRVMAAALFFAACTPDDPQVGEYTIYQYFTVSFDTQKGSDCPPMSEKSGNEITLPTPSKNGGYTFSGWYMAGVGGAFCGKSGDKYTVTCNITLVAHWTQKISFDAKGGEACAAIIAPYGDKTTNPLPSTSKDNYIFDGWYTADSGGTKVGNAGDKPVFVDGDMTLYAQWTQQTYTISFNSQGGGDVSQMSGIAVGGSITLPTPSREGYTFDGWYTLAEGGEKAGDAGGSYTGNGNITLYARWTQIFYTVSFSLGGSNTYEKLDNITYGTSITLLPTPSRAGYTFDGWYTSSSGGTRVGGAGDNYTVSANITLYAHWTYSREDE